MLWPFVRILYVNDFGYLFGGAEVYSFGMAEALRARGHDVRWLTTSLRQGKALFRLSSDALPFHDDWFCRGTDSPNRIRQGLQQLFNRSAVSALRTALREWRPEVVHLHGFLSQLSPLILRELGSVPTVATVQTYKAICPKATKMLPDGTICNSPFGLSCVKAGCLTLPEYAHERLKRAIFGGQFSRVRIWIAPSVYVQTVLENELGVKVRVHPNGTDFHQHRGQKKNGRGIVLYAGRLVDTKGLDILIEAMALLKVRLPHVRLWIAGNGPCEGALKEQAKRLGLSETVRFLGHLERSELVELHTEVDVLAAPARWPEPLPLTTIESMTLGTPVVATAVGGHGDVVVDGWNGRLVRPGDALPLADALEEVITDGAFRQQLEKACLKTGEKFRMDRMARDMEKLYRDARQTDAPMPSWRHESDPSRTQNGRGNALRNRAKLRGSRAGAREHGTRGTPHLP